MKNYLTQILLLLACVNLYSQNMDLKWSEQFIYDNKVDGFFDYYLGANSSFVYGKFSNLASSQRKKNKKVKLIAFDKTSMKKAGEAEVFGYDDLVDETKKGMEYFRTIVLENVIYILWTVEDDGVTEVYAESYTPKLKKMTGLKKVYEYNTAKKNVDNLLVIYNKDIGNKILIGREFATKEDNEPLKIEYKIINEDFSPAGSAKITLPIVMIKKRSRSDLVCTYEFGDDENLYISDRIKITGEEKKKLKKGEASTYPIIMQVNTKRGSLHEYSIRFPKKNTFNFSWMVTKTGIKLYGFFSDLDKDEKGRDTHGIFYLSMDQGNFKPKDQKFSYFDKSFLDKLYEADKENQKKAGRRGKEKDKQSDEESIDDNYVIEEVIDDGKDIVLFCSIMYNWQNTVCTTSSNGGQSCHTYYYCTKSNVTAFKLSTTGDIVWASNLDRSYTFSGWNVYDVKVVKSEDNYLVLYQSAFQINKDEKNRKSKKSSKQMDDRLEYAIFNGTTGAYKKSEYQVNGFNTKKEERKSIKTSNISLYDNKMYISSSSRVKFRPTIWLSCLCPPVFYVLSFSGNSRTGKGYLGTVNVSK